jgi:hypothetical protein
MKPSSPRTRRQRVKWLQQNRGDAFILGFEYKTDREVKRIFELEFQGRRPGDSSNKVIDPGEIADELSL